ncbi:acyl-CoA dehydrogenase family protein [Chelatococcus reniformis]|uniref:Acyl-CoA dehydrogenase n=1 Tax=Chelatococcus reniformis TaxID=1494448 RepID=A0A916URU9_9HYPH|nr:acyl-CoA dehydrogenase family protein [Chelatococcus reniformis]GGC85264.1 acyl-CoA dehydrogenase [Chelatococcus reniformis]
MNFEWTERDKAFRAEVVDFLARELPPDWAAIARHGPGSKEQTEFSLGFCAKLAAAGLLVPHWPQEHGGRGGSVWEHFILGEEMWAAGEPRGPQYMNVNWIGPTILRFGTPEQRERYVPDITAGCAIWCQGFSEPSAGSDLASLRTRAERDGDGFIINGSKVWTSYAGLADHCFLLARTSGQRKDGICIFLLSMATPGITVRPIPSLVGNGDLHEVFFQDVRIPASAMLGEEGKAWSLITYALANERVGIARYALSARALAAMVERLKADGSWRDDIVRHRAGQALAACEAARVLVYRVVDQRARGLPPNAESSLTRVAVAAADHAVANFALDFLPDAFADDSIHLLKPHHERAIAAGIASGATEIQLGIVATDHLDLPRS